MTAAEYRKKLGLPPAGYDHNQNHHLRVSNPKPQRDQKAALGDSKKGQGEGDGRTLVRITSHRVRLLDHDNHTGGCKHLIDALKYNGEIEDDSPKHIRLETDQVKVAHYHEEFIEVIIQKP